MNKYLSLTRVLFKNTAGMMADGKTKKRNVYLLYGLLGLCLIPTLFLLYMMFDSTIEAFAKLHQEGAVLALGFYLANLITFVFSIFLIPSIFYFSKDSETLLALPLKPQTILSAKFTVCLMYEYVFTLGVCIPIILAYLQNISVSPIFFLYLLIVLILLPVFPLVLSSVISMLIMRFVPFFKNRDRFNMIGGILAVVIAFGFSYFMNTPTLNNNDPGALITMLLSGDNSMIEMFSYLFPNIRFAAEGLVNTDMLQIIFYIGSIVAAIFVFLLMGKFFYFKGAIGFNETGSKRKVINDKEMKKASQRHSKMHSYMMKEWKLLLRTPVYFLNCISTTFIFPLVFGVIYLTGGSTTTGDIDLSALKNIDYSGFMPYILLIGLAFGFFFANLNLVSSTSISREGQNVMFMKYVPMPLGKQVLAKANVGILLAIISMLISVVFIAFVIPGIPFMMYLGLALPSIITIVLANYLGIMIDMAHPKLVWEQEAAAVKQNMSGMIAMFGSWLIILPFGFLIYCIPSDYTILAFAGISIVMIAACVILYMKMEKIAQYFFKKI